MRRASAARNRAAAPVEKAQLHAKIARDSCHRILRALQRPLRRENAAVFVGIGITDHDLLNEYSILI